MSENPTTEAPEGGDPADWTNEYIEELPNPRGLSLPEGDREARAIKGLVKQYSAGLQETPVAAPNGMPVAAPAPEPAPEAKEPEPASDPLAEMMATLREMREDNARLRQMLEARPTPAPMATPAPPSEGAPKNGHAMPAGTMADWALGVLGEDATPEDVSDLAEAAVELEKYKSWAEQHKGTDMHPQLVARRDQYQRRVNTHMRYARERRAAAARDQELRDEIAALRRDTVGKREAEAARATAATELEGMLRAPESREFAERFPVVSEIRHLEGMAAALAPGIVDVAISRGGSPGDDSWGEHLGSAVHLIDLQMKANRFNFSLPTKPEKVDQVAEMMKPTLPASLHGVIDVLAREAKAKLEARTAEPAPTRAPPPEPRGDAAVSLPPRDAPLSGPEAAASWSEQEIREQLHKAAMSVKLPEA